ncbi:MAG: hypothetical protein NUV74_05165 [Candidatus Brocadiaceae bacterium]|nr:hypothetical protein [Candidatus Brocadiaceae bacterium]
MGRRLQSVGRMIERAALLGEIARLRAAIRQTLADNGHLADGDVCTLRILKDALGIHTCRKCGADMQPGVTCPECGWSTT